MGWPRLELPLRHAANGKVHVTYRAESRFLEALSELIARRRRQHVQACPDVGPIAKTLAYLATLSEAYGPLTPSPYMSLPIPVAALVLDSSALEALGRGDDVARAHLARAVGMSARVLVPATILLDVRLGSIADAVGTLVPVDDAIARCAGRLMGRARLTMPLDALTVAVAATQESAALLTTDRLGISALAHAAEHPALHVLTLAQPKR